MIGTFAVVSQRSIRRLREIGREDLVPWIRGIQLGFVGYSLTSLFLQDDWARYYRLNLALIASSAVVADTLVKQHQQKLAKTLSRRKTNNHDLIAVS
jgi:hypothetical protein